MLREGRSEAVVKATRTVSGHRWSPKSGRSHLPTHAQQQHLFERSCQRQVLLISREASLARSGEGRLQAFATPGGEVLLFIVSYLVLVEYRQHPAHGGDCGSGSGSVVLDLEHPFASEHPPCEVVSSLLA